MRGFYRKPSYGLLALAKFFRTLRAEKRDLGFLTMIKRNKLVRSAELNVRFFPTPPVRLELPPGSVPCKPIFPFCFWHERAQQWLRPQEQWQERQQPSWLVVWFGRIRIVNAGKYTWSEAFVPTVPEAI